MNHPWLVLKLPVPPSPTGVAVGARLRFVVPSNLECKFIGCNPMHPHVLGHQITIHFERAQPVARKC